MKQLTGSIQVLMDYKWRSCEDWSMCLQHGFGSCIAYRRSLAVVWNSSPGVSLGAGQRPQGRNDHAGPVGCGAVARW